MPNFAARVNEYILFIREDQGLFEQNRSITNHAFGIRLDGKLFELRTSNMYVSFLRSLKHLFFLKERHFTINYDIDNYLIFIPSMIALQFLCESWLPEQSSNIFPYL